MMLTVVHSKKSKHLVLMYKPCILQLDMGLALDYVIHIMYMKVSQSSILYLLNTTVLDSTIDSTDH